MNIVIFGAGAIGSLIGAKLSKKNFVILYGRKNHIDEINRNGLEIIGKTIFFNKLYATDNIKEIKINPDIVILSVKSYDTVVALKQIEKIIDKNTILLTIQNGLDNIEKIKKMINPNQIIAGITTEGSLFIQPGKIKHTGKGITKLGELNGKQSIRIKKIVELFNNAGIYTISSNDIIEEIWIKAIINSSINPLTAIFRCKNGYLIKNPVLFEIVRLICIESSNIAIKKGFNINPSDIFKKTIEVIRNTNENYSSMYQSYINNKITEINSINGKFIYFGKEINVETSLNEILLKLIDPI